MKVEWIAAALNPSDVAPHPNFMRTEEISPASLFALLVQLRLADFARLMDADEVVRDAPIMQASGMSVQEGLIIAAARSSLDADSSLRGAERLAELATSGQVDPACGAAATLLGSVVFSELDRHSSAVALLEQTIRGLPPADNPDATLLHAVLLQQLAMRRLEMGLSGVDEARRVLDLVGNIRIGEVTRFRVSRGVRSRSSRTIRLLLEELRAAADAHVVDQDQDLSSRAWVRLVRSPAPHLGLQNRRDAENGLVRYIDQRFDEVAGSTRTTIFSGDPVEEPIYRVLLHYELLGAARHARNRRSLLGKLRLLRQDAGDPVWSRQDAIRLLRQADDINSLKPALRHTRAGGPLLALSSDASQIIHQRLDPSRLRRVELAVLSAAAHLLSVEEARRALDAVLTCISQGVPAPSARWEALSVRLEDAWNAAVELAATSESLDAVAVALLEAAQDAPSDDELLVRALTRAAMGIEWEGIEESTRASWAQWLMDNPSPTASAMMEVVGPEVGVEPAISLDSQAPIELGASLLNRFFRTGVRPAEEDLIRLQGAIAAQLRQIRDDAARGAYSFGAVSAGDVAVGLALHADATDLWASIIEFLLDERVSRTDKAPALERLAQASEPLPSNVLRALGSRLHELLVARSVEPFGSHLLPFPPALRLGAAHSLISDEGLLNQLTDLATSAKPAGRVEAARTLGLVARAGQDSDWVAVLTLQLSHDLDAVVRGEAGRSLGALIRQSERHRSLLDQRVLELLAEDGLVVPLLVLRGLQGDEGRHPLPPALTRRITEVAVAHPARGVRLQAQAVLQSSPEE